MTDFSLTMSAALFDRLHSHLFPGDHDEHGAIITAGVSETPRGLRLIARELILAEDGSDYLPGERGYRMLSAPFVTQNILHCRNERLAYLAVHNHGGQGSVSFSRDDMRSHERGYPALLDIGRGVPVGALVFAEGAAAGDLWLSKERRLPLSTARIVGSRWQTLTPGHNGRRRTVSSDQYHRQSLIFGDAGQAVLRNLKVGVIGAGGVGSVLIELLSRLGVGWLVVADPDRVERTNLPRLVGASPWDAMSVFTEDGRPDWIQRLGRGLATKKVALARRVARRANPSIKFDAIFGDFLQPEVARLFFDCDYLLLAADPMPVRHLFNSLAHQYSIPSAQVGTKVRVARETGEVVEVYSTSRPVGPAAACLWCNGLIPVGRLQEQALSEEERRRQRYVDDPLVEAPSVITLNATAAAHAANDFLFTVTGLSLPDAPNDFVRFRPRERKVTFDEPRRDSTCPECATRGGRGDLGPRLPMKA